MCGQCETETPKNNKPEATEVTVFLPWGGERDAPIGYVRVITRDGRMLQGQSHLFKWQHDELTWFHNDVVYWARVPTEPQGATGNIHLDRDFKPDSAVNEAVVDAHSAPALLAQAKKHMEDRAATYDTPGGERSMARAVQAFNALTGHELHTSQGWLLMSMVKLVRSETRAAPHKDSIEDNIAYGALYGEDRLREERAS